jgi:dTDP-4-dehydrorhamnose reductase
MKVLVTGAGGQLGRALLGCAPAGSEVAARSHGELDVADPAAVRRAFDALAPAVLVNAAAYTAVDRAESEPMAAARVNAHGPAVLAAACQERGARLVHVSTDFVFDGAASTPYAYDAPTHPLGVYGRTKRDGESAALAALGERCLVVRTAWLYAATGRNFVTTMVRLMRERGAVSVVADQVGTPTSAASLAAVLWRAVATPSLNGVQHYTDAGVASWYDFAVAIAEEGYAAGLFTLPVTVSPLATAEYPTPATRPAYSVLDSRHLRAALGLVAVHWRAALRPVIAEIARG